MPPPSPSEPTQDEHLAKVVRDYARRVATGEAPPETVAVSVSRRMGFQNLALSGSGHQIVVDEPTTFGGFGEGGDPAELLLAAAGASLSVTLTAHAALAGLAIETIAMDLSARMEAKSFFDPDGDADSGILEAAIVLTLRTAAPRPAVVALAETALRASPVLASLKHKPRIELVVEASS